ncbi:Granaticin polyketide synthase ketoacyl reductase 2 [Hyphodiscus hymeniophilus]|uniref:Granaticin polyketide synthase ketoacyl reductase 2 n=1 Tax=Hyphodiscus hymeniophilus TaxID=353542 RepID=A0A9P6VK49_9HELO|nr:Granaticin polyketide synthase ketoacyl reductase 2 [Hyphodiscus hymeniophilus]
MASPPLVALITAGSAGLGAATAKLFATSGMRVVVNYASNASRAEQVVQELEKLSPIPKQAGTKNFTSIRADLSKKDDVIRLVDETTAEMGRLDVLFSNGGWTMFRNFQDLDDNMNEDDWDRCFTMNVKSHLWLMHAARKWLDESEGVFITTASMAGVKPSGSSLPYSVTKAAQIHLVKGLATIASPRVRVNSVSPGLLLTDWGLQFPEAKREAYKARTQLKKIPSVEDVAEQVLCFVKSRTVTGVNAIIDAGVSL